VKTISLKKVSAVAVASLGFGLLSVVPANATTAAYTTSASTITPAIPLVGSTVTVPLTAAKAVGGATDVANTGQWTATFTAVPANSARVSADLVANIDALGAAWATGLTTITASANKLNFSTAVNSTAVTATQVGAFTFTPDVPGTYKISVLGAVSAVDVGTPTFTNTNTTNMVVTVTGAQLSQATSGKGTATGTATTGGSAAVFFTPRVTTATVTNFNITSSGVGAITSPVACASQSATVTSSVPTCAGDTAASGSSVATLNGTNYADGIKYISPTAVVTGTGELTGSAANGGMTFLATSTVAGTQTITVTEISTSTGAPTTRATVTITWGVAPTTSAALSTSYICAGSVTTCSADATILAPKTAKTAAADAIATIQASQFDSAGTSKVSSQTLSVTITGPGTLGIGSSSVPASSGRALTGTAGQNLISVFGDGTEGKATITISAGTTVLATETVSFYGAVAKVTVTQNLSNPLANGYLLGSANATSGTTMTAAGSWANASGNVPAVVLELKDASGNLVPSQAANISAVTSDATVMSKTITAVEDTTAAVGAGYYNVSVSSAAGSAAGKSATLTFRVLLADGTTYVSAPAATTFTIGSSKISKVAITVNKTAYTAGDPAVMTVTATDAAGLAVADGLYASSTKTAPLFSKSVVAISTLPTSSTLTTVGGKKEYKFYAPSVPGSFTVTGDYYDNDGAVVSTTATSSVTDANAGLLTQIDALNAKIVALNALIAKIMKKLGVK
jgi:hypothetical protein